MRTDKESVAQIRNLLTESDHTLSDQVWLELEVGIEVGIEVGLESSTGIGHTLQHGNWFECAALTGRRLHANN